MPFEHELCGGAKVVAKFMDKEIGKSSQIMKYDEETGKISIYSEDYEFIGNHYFEL